ncbi:DUF6573 family protein [Maridesulfovibrio sp.]|uniref:DUF6573 family protein n=1 Tax=Maridesulfovibrio sp. TaxID=2795000 RepID=UPI0029CA3BDA|nr:DUF6573 family protein [Maridesulfovibrio sp.]
MVINCDPLFRMIYSYTRKQAIEDGNLIDVTGQAKETGFKVPVAVSLNLYERYITPPKGLEGEGQSVTGRSLRSSSASHRRPMSVRRSESDNSWISFSVMSKMSCIVFYL